MDATLSFERTPSGAGVRLRMWRDAFAVRPGDDKAIDTLIEVMGAELPRLALAEAARLNRPPIVIVTGRAALWPLLHERIEQTVAAHGGALMSRRKPFRPEQMKQAVVLGAVNLARETAGRADNEASLDNPIGLISFKIDTRSPGSSGTGRIIDKVMLLAEGNKIEDTRRVVIDGPFIIARIIPGLHIKEGQERRLELFQDLYRITRNQAFRRADTRARASVAEQARSRAGVDGQVAARLVGAATGVRLRRAPGNRVRALRRRTHLWPRVSGVSSRKRTRANPSSRRPRRRDSRRPAPPETSPETPAPKPPPTEPTPPLASARHRQGNNLAGRTRKLFEVSRFGIPGSALVAAVCVAALWVVTVRWLRMRAEIKLAERQIGAALRQPNLPLKDAAARIKSIETLMSDLHDENLALRTRVKAGNPTSKLGELSPELKRVGTVADCLDDAAKAADALGTDPDFPSDRASLAAGVRPARLRQGAACSSQWLHVQRGASSPCSSAAVSTRH